MLIAAGLVVGVVVLVSALDEDQGDGPPAPVARSVSIPGLGLRFTHPATWRRSIDGRVFRLRSPDGSVVMTFSSPLAGRAPGAAKAALERTLRGRLSGARLVDEGSGRLGGRRVTSFEMAGRTRSGPVRALAVLDSTPYRTYAVTVITAARPSGTALRQVRAILDSVRLSKPVRSRAQR